MMVRSCISPARLRRLTIALVVAAGLGAQVDASPIASTIYYQTDGWVGSVGQNAPDGAIAFTGASHATSPVSLPGTFSLGNFDIASLAANETLTASNTPFSVIVDIGVESAAKGPGQSWVSSEVEVSGVLNGTIIGNSQSSMVATVTSVQQVGSGTLPFPMSDFHVVLGPVAITPYDDNPVRWDLPGSPFHYSLSSPLTAQVSVVSSVPEPTTMAVLCAGLAGYAFRRRRGR